MKKGLILTLGVLFIVGCGNNQQQSETGFQGVAEKKDYLAQGMQYLQDSDIKNAIRSFDQAIKQDPKNPKNYLVLGEVYMRLKNYDSAVDALTGASRVDPDNGDTFYLIAVARSFQGRNEEAIVAAQRSIEIYVKKKDEENFKRSVMLLERLKKQTSEQVQTKI